MADSDLVAFDRASARLIAADVRRGLATAYEDRAKSRPPRFDNRRWMPFLNETGFVVPPHGILAVTGKFKLSDLISGSADGETILRCIRPSSDYYRWFVVNSGTEVPVDDFGDCTDDGPLDALYDGSVPTIGKGMGPKPSSFALWAGYPEVATVRWVEDSGNNIVRVGWKQITEFWGKVNGNVTKGGTGNVSIYAGAFGSETDTGIDAIGVGFPASNLTLNDPVNVGYMNGQLEGYPRSC